MSSSLSSEAIALTLERARRDPAVTHAGFRALHLVAVGADRSGAVIGSTTALAAASGMAAPTFSIVMDRLVALGYVNLTRRGGRCELKIKIRRPGKTLD